MDGPDTIESAAGLSGGVIALGLGEIEITEALAIDARPLAEDITIDASDASRIFNIAATTGDFTIGGLTLTGGLTTGNNVDSNDHTFSGGAIRSLARAIL
jgi:hypothetical protein